MTTRMSSTASPILHLARLAGRLTLAGLIVGAFALTGCDDDDGEGFRVDPTPPSIPTGVGSITGDGEVFLVWTPNLDRDLAGYRVFVNVGAELNNDGTETFDLLDEIGALEDGFYEDNGTPGDIADDYLIYRHAPVVNGEYYSYAISAFDDDGNESGLSLNVVIDVPRPEGTVAMTFAETAPATAGFDLSDGTESPVPFDSAVSDFHVSRDGQGVVRFVVDAARAKIQDAGLRSFDGVSFAENSGYSATGRVEVIVGHTYLLRLAQGPSDFGANDNYAKITVLEITGSDVFLRWGYQEVDGELQLRPSDLPTRDDDRIPHLGGAR